VLDLPAAEVQEWADERRRSPAASWDKRVGPAAP